MKKVLFIGLGNMGSALIHGILKNNDLGFEVYGYDHTDAKQTKALSENPKLHGLRSLEDVNKFGIDTFVLGVRPENVAGLAHKIANLGVAGKTIVSMAGKVDLKELTEFFPHSHVIRIMPNMNAIVGKSVTAITHQNAAPDAVKDVERLFNHSGITVHVPESKLAAFSAMAGSAPAFVYRFYNAFVDFAINHGFSVPEAYQIVGNMISGSAKRVMNSSLDLTTLSSLIATPGGSTAKGLRILEKNHFEEIVELALEATRKKAG